MNCWQCLDIIALALMLVHIVVVLFYVSHQYRLACRAESIDADASTFQRGRRKLVADLNIKVGTLNSIAFVAPYLGLAGTCTGIVTGLGRIGIEADSGLAAVILGRVVPIAFITTAAGLLVAIPAALSYNYLRTRIDLLEGRAYCEVPPRRNRHWGTSQKFPLAARSSKTSFPLLAVPVLAVLTGVVFMCYSSYETPTGLWIGMTPETCEYDGGDRLIILHLTDDGKMFLNQEREEDWNSLIGHLSEIYRLRLHRTLYLVADDGVPFQRVADAVDMAKNAMAVETSNPLDTTVRLITPRARDASCVKSLAIRYGRLTVK